MCLRHTRASLRGVEVLRESPKIPSKESALQVWLRPNPTIRDRFVPAAGMAERSLGGNWARTQQPHLSVVGTHTHRIPVLSFVVGCKPPKLPMSNDKQLWGSNSRHTNKKVTCSKLLFDGVVLLGVWGG